MKKTVAIILLGLSLCSAAFAQSKTETKNYQKAIAKPSLKAYDAFLKKFPNSVYSADIEARRDTLLNITPYSFEKAGEIAETLLPGCARKSFRALPLRKDALDYIFIPSLEGEALEKGYIRIHKAVLQKGAWALESSIDMPYGSCAEGQEVEFTDSLSAFKIKGETYFKFALYQSSAQSEEASYFLCCLEPLQDYFETVSFNGKKAAAEDGAYKIIGRVDDLNIDTNRAQIRLMLSEIKENPRLCQISDADYYTDLAIDWWLEQNSVQGKVASGKLAFSLLENECSLVSGFQTAKGKQDSAKYKAAIMDIRGYTVIVVYQKTSKDYVLAWAEPECKDRKKDQLLSSIYFTNQNSLKMNYYKGNRTFSYTLNLASKTLSK